MEQELILTRGIPASGKSTWAREWASRSPNRGRVCRDDIRFATFTKYHGLTRQQEDLVTKIEQASVEALLRAGKDVVVDAMHVRPMYVKAWRKWLHNTGLPVNLEICEFIIDLDEAILRDSQREKSVGEDVLRNIWQKYTKKGKFLPVEEWTPDVGVSLSQTYVPPVGAPEVWIVDIDGTVAQNVGRGYHDYHRVSEDAPRRHVIDVVRSLHASGYGIIFLSGRPDSCYEETRLWLKENLGIPGAESPLFMRKSGDFRKDFIIKNEIFDEHIRNAYSVVGCIDDRPQVLRLWDSLGIPALDAAPLSGEF